MFCLCRMPLYLTDEQEMNYRQGTPLNSLIHPHELKEGAVVEILSSLPGDPVERFTIVMKNGEFELEPLHKGGRQRKSRRRKNKKGKKDKKSRKHNKKA